MRERTTSNASDADREGLGRRRRGRGRGYRLIVLVAAGGCLRCGTSVKVCPLTSLQDPDI